MRLLLSAASEAERAYLCKAFTESLNSVETADNFEYAHFLAAQEPFDTVVACVPADCTLAALGEAVRGFATLAERPSVMLILPRATPSECVRLLRAGADACFVQPYSVTEVIERMRALQRHARVVPGAAVRLDPLTRELTSGRRRLPLTQREYLLLECLLRQSGSPVARERLIRYAWPDKEGVEPSSLNLMVLRLRRRLEEHALPLRIGTVSHYGYQVDMT
jgi:DNA-binding response OmpR family regulator